MDSTYKVPHRVSGTAYLALSMNRSIYFKRDTSHLYVLSESGLYRLHEDHTFDRLLLRAIEMIRVMRAMRQHHI